MNLWIWAQCMRSGFKHTFLLSLILVAGCERPTVPTAESALSRWYTEEQVAQGTVIFQTHCATCHGLHAEGTADWLTLDANGNYPPPPLDGSAHAWHHPLEDLQKVVKEGGVAFGGVMPAFGSALDDTDILAAISYFQSQWPDDIYDRWLKIEEARRGLENDATVPTR